MENNRRQHNRVSMNCPIDLKIDSQITIEGRLKNISPKSAFIEMRSSSVSMQINDEFDFQFQYAKNNAERDISGRFCISRIVEGQGIAVYFTQMDEESSSSLKQLVG